MSWQDHAAWRPDRHVVVRNRFPEETKEEVDKAKEARKTPRGTGGITWSNVILRG